MRETTPHELGYQLSGSRSLHGRFGCELVTRRSTGLVTSDCIVSEGNSGGPVMFKRDGQWQLAAVISARQKPGGEAIAVQVNAWLRRQVDDALSREERRRPRVQD